MINKDFDVLKNWMFGSLSSLLDNKSPNPNLNVLKMSIGEPQLGPPKFIRNKFHGYIDRSCPIRLSLPTPETLSTFANSRKQILKAKLRGRDSWDS